ncbi:MAG: helix-turn-helix domain-containing protein [Candidatus Methanodesulfokora sp.]
MNEVEGETLEFKRSLSDFDEILATISTFSNTKGGKIPGGCEGANSECNCPQRLLDQESNIHKNI